MRVRAVQDLNTAQDAQEFADYLLRIGDGRHERCAELGPDFVQIPPDMLLDVSSLDVPLNSGDQVAHNTFTKLSLLIVRVCADFNRGNQPESYFADRIILIPKNAGVLAINDMILNKLPGETEDYQSVDTLDVDDEFLRQEHGDLLKMGVPVMLIRNFNTKEGLCNGTRLRVVQLRRNCMKAAIMSGAITGKEVVIPRGTVISKNSGFPFEVRRKQFPVQVAFAMTINKSQGQSIQYLGLFLPCCGDLVRK